MWSSKIPNQLLEQACPSIRYRLRLEVLDQPHSDGQMLALQNQILEDAGWMMWFQRMELLATAHL